MTTTSEVANCCSFASGTKDVQVVVDNDGGCDPQVRFWAGTMAYDESPGAGTLYRLEEAALERQLDAGRVFSVTGLDARGPGCPSYRGQLPPAGSPR